MKEKKPDSEMQHLLDAVRKLIIGILTLLVILILTLTFFMNQKGLQKWIESVQPQSRTIISKEKEGKGTESFNDLRSNALNYFEPIPSIDPALSDALVQLGKELYNDTRLSKKGNISCNSCHNLTTYGVDNLPTSPGDNGKLGARNSPSSFYAALHRVQFWDGRAKDVEEQAGMPILNPIEHNIPSKQYLINRLKRVPEYQEKFKSAFPADANPITYTNITNAIGAFERTLLPESRFDLWLKGEDRALTEQEKKGLSTFIETGCISCHSGVVLGGQQLQKFGLYGDYWEFTKSQTVDRGVLEVSQLASDKYVFKVPSLRNIEMTYPYFHDGSVDSLDEAIRIMAKLQTNSTLEDVQVEAIKAFLSSLTAGLTAVENRGMKQQR